jgi:orotidine-5'-phosphate decarboxylase
MKKQPRDFLALALDNISSLAAIENLVHATAPFIGTFKVGLEQYTRFGPPVLDFVRVSGRKIFLDLKYHDIPNTVQRTVLSAGDLGVHFLTLHTQGGIEMLRAARAAADSVKKKKGRAPRLIGVTLLTSISQESLEKELCVKQKTGEYVKHLVSLAVEAGLDGIVCSAADLPVVKPHIPAHFEIFTPGIRPAGMDANDQKRIATPQDAIKNGATILVLGRAVTEAKDPGKAAEEIVGQLF